MLISRRTALPGIDLFKDLASDPYKPIFLEEIQGKDGADERI